MREGKNNGKMVTYFTFQIEEYVSGDKEHIIDTVFM